MDNIDYNHFSKVKLKVGKITSVEDIPKKDRLYLLKVDVGEDKERTLFAGIKEHYSKEELQDKLIIVIVNLEPKTMFGITSEGMLLASSFKTESGEKVSLLTPDKDMPVGSDVF